MAQPGAWQPLLSLPPQPWARFLPPFFSLQTRALGGICAFEACTCPWASPGCLQWSVFTKAKGSFGSLGWLHLWADQVERGGRSKRSPGPRAHRRGGLGMAEPPHACGYRRGQDVPGLSGDSGRSLTSESLLALREKQVRSQAGGGVLQRPVGKRFLDTRWPR